MPTRKQNAIARKMESRVEALENEITEVCAALATMETVVKTNHESLITKPPWRRW
ncbi:hypothetical protein A2U01_0032765 [Trifolium medium]|uniref:Uncharacterized protein n=1 Tax=Trifolium medium TaxID=97028 RepID=A0A392PHU5_9FABA|nr:hypothetical protein [Trifolium medium]